MMLPHVVRFNAEHSIAATAYAELASAPEIACVSDGIGEAVDALVSELNEFLVAAEMPRQLRECGVEKSKLPALAAEAAKQWTGTFNPRQVGEREFLALYEAAY